MAGMGVLALPYMLKQGGWLCTVLIAACAVACNYTGKLIVECCYDHSCDGLKKVRHSYADVGYKAFGRVGRITAQAVLVLEPVI